LFLSRWKLKKQENIKNTMSARHVIVLIQSDADILLWGGIPRNLEITSGNLQVFLWQGGIPKSHQMAGGYKPINPKNNSNCTQVPIYSKL
jgi:hypothetical protein